MQQLGERTPKSPPSAGFSVWLPFCLLAMLGGMWAVGLFWLAPFKNWSPYFRYGAVTFVVVGFTAAAANILLTRRFADRSQREETQARQRVRLAEDKLSDELRRGSKVLTFEGVVPSGLLDDLRNDPPASDNEVEDAIVSVGEDGFFEFDTDALRYKPPGFKLRVPPFPFHSFPAFQAQPTNDGLTLAALWDVTHGRMDLYHQIVTGQARRSFGAAQVAMGIGFVLLVGFAVLAAEAKTTAAAISAGGLGAVGAAFAAYIGKTFIRSQESAASHLRAYFDQPLELSRYLAAERLLADAKDLTAEQHAAIVSSLVESIATAGQHDYAKTGKSGRQPRGRASR